MFFPAVLDDHHHCTSTISSIWLNYLIHGHDFLFHFGYDLINSLTTKKKFLLRLAVNMLVFIVLADDQALLNRDKTGHF